MSIDAISEVKSPEALHQELLDRGKFYKKGFVVLLQGLINDLDIFDSGEKNDERINSARSEYEQMRVIYDEMLRKGLAESPDADLLLPIVSILDELALEVEKILREGVPMESALKLIRAVLSRGNSFRARLRELENQLRAHPGYEKTYLSTTDIFGNHWNKVL